MIPVDFVDRFVWFDAVNGAGELNDAACRVAWRLVAHLSEETGDAWPSLETMAEALHASPRSVRRGIASLAAAGFVDADRSGGRARAGHYRLTLPNAAEVALAEIARRRSKRAEKADTDVRLSEGDQPEKADRFVTKGGQTCPENPVRFVRPTSLKNISRTSSARASDERNKNHRADDRSRGRGLGRIEGDPAARSRPVIQRHDEGRIQREVAERLGPDGWEVIFALDERTLWQLCDAQRFGRMTPELLARARLAVREHRDRPAPSDGDEERRPRSHPLRI